MKVKRHPKCMRGNERMVNKKLKHNGKQIKKQEAGKQAPAKNKPVPDWTMGIATQPTSYPRAWSALDPKPSTVVLALDSTLPSQRRWETDKLELEMV